jgi:hypothetical protein
MRPQTKFNSRLSLAFVCGNLFAFDVNAAAQVLRDPPTPFGPLVYGDQFTDPAALTGISDGLKNIPMGTIPGWYINLGGSLRERFESFANAAFDFGAAGGRGINWIGAWATFNF